MSAARRLLLFSLASTVLLGAAAQRIATPESCDGILQATEDLALLQLPAATAARHAAARGPGVSGIGTPHHRAAAVAPPEKSWSEVELESARGAAIAVAASLRRTLRGFGGSVAQAAGSLHFIWQFNFADNYGEWIAIAFLTMVIQSCLVLIMAHFYLDAVKVMPRTDLSMKGLDLTTWSSSLLRDAVSDGQILVWSCFCPCVRWADTLHMSGVGHFWPAVGLSICGLLLAESTFGLSLVASFTIMILFRRRLRRKFGMASEGCLEVAADVAAVCCCLPCAVAQEARHVEAASLAGHPVVVMAWPD